MKVDVVLLTKNSERPCLKECLDSIYKNVPVCHLIVVDGGSTDNTLNIVSQYSNVIIIDDSNGSRATARQKGIENVDSEWFMFVDSDVILCKDWFKKAWKLVHEDVGAIWGVAIPLRKSWYNRVKAMAKLYRKSVLDLLVERPRLRRYLTHDTLIRKEAVEGIKIPSYLYVWEDHYIGNFIVTKGFKWINAKNPYCLHYANEGRTIQDNMLNGMFARKMGLIKAKDIIMKMMWILPKSIWIITSTGDFMAGFTEFKNFVYLFKGWLSCK